jgi:predicted Zn-dependent protease with MMP-like domain
VWPGGARADNELVIDIEPDRFEEMVTTALDGLPEDLGTHMRNVAVTVEHDPGRPGLLGLYQGVPLTSRTSAYAGVQSGQTMQHPPRCHRQPGDLSAHDARSR